MIDTHAHLNFPELTVNLDQIIKDSQKAGLTGIIVASSSIEDSIKAVDLAKKYPNFLYTSVGIHPQKTDPENKNSIEDQIKNLRLLIKENRQQVVAIGETGLDFSQPPPSEEERSKEAQTTLFRAQISLAEEFTLPLIIHAREANDEIIEILSQHQVNGVFHCYSGGKKRIEKILNLSGKWFFGLDGNLTYDQGLQIVASLIPKEKIILETDSPFLTPEPKRGELNTPTNLPFIVGKLSELWQVDKQSVISQTLENTKNLFNINC